VVFAVRVKDTWFGDRWDEHLERWHNGLPREANMPCLIRHIPAKHILAKVMYPNGTDPEFLPTWCNSWDAAMALKGST